MIQATGARLRDFPLRNQQARLKFKEDPIPSSVNGGINPDPKK
jgi:hypothetical protein